MNDIIRYTLLFGAIFILFISLLAGAIYITQKPYQDACEEAGFESYNGMSGGINYCEDAENNLHTVKFISDGVFKMKVKNIKIYDYNNDAVSLDGEQK